MNNLTTRKIVLGMLMSLVLAFSVQGIADAADLPLSKTSGDLETHSVNDPFDISFTVGIRSNTTAIYNEMSRLVSETGALIDSQGYQVVYATNGTAYRTLQTQPSGLNYRAEVGPEREITEDPDNNWIIADGPYHVDTSRYAYDQDGNQIYTDMALSTLRRVPEGISE